MIDYIARNWIAILTWGLIIKIILYLIIQRYKEKKNEDFEDRDN